ncbi:MAG: DUF3883 domain-containing protein [Bacteroidota bacterium]
MKLEQLRAKQHVFLKEFDASIVADIHSRLNAFKNVYPVSELNTLPIDDYIYGKFRINHHRTFCYWMEKELSDFGRIAGSPCFQYGGWYGTHGEDKEVHYRKTKKIWGNRRGSLPKNNWPYTGTARSGIKNDFRAIAQNSIANKFKEKILAAYFPETYLSIYADDYLNDILKYFNLDDSASYKEAPIFQQQRLIKWKEADEIMTHWTLTQFAIFINRELNAFYYSQKGASENEENKVPRFPELGEISPIFNAIEIDQAFENSEKASVGIPSSGNSNKNNYTQKSIRDTAVGIRGEQIVLQWERRKLQARPDLLKKLEWLSEHTDSYGYDINSVELDGTAIQIEVKTTTRPVTDKADFYLREFERLTALQCKNYYVYYVFDILNTSPKIWAVKNPFQCAGKGVHLAPVVYNVSLKKRE